MLVTHKTTIDFTHWQGTPRFDVVEGDLYSRNLECTLLSGGRAFEPPGGCTAVIRYRKPDHTGGVYDTLPDGTRAWSIEKNILTLEFTPQLFTAPGTVDLFVTLMDGETKLHCFRMELYVRHVPKGLPSSQRYINITSFIPQSEDAVAGQYLVAKEVDGKGRVTKIGTAEIIAEDGEKDESSKPMDADTLGGKLPDAYVLTTDLRPERFDLTPCDGFVLTDQRNFRIGRFMLCSCRVTTPQTMSSGWQVVATSPYPFGYDTYCRFPDSVGPAASRDFCFSGNILRAFFNENDTSMSFLVHMVSYCGIPAP